MARIPATELWRQADQVLDQLLDLEPSVRLGELERLTEPGPLRERVLYLLEALDQPGLLDRQQFSGIEAPPINPPPDLSGRDFGVYHLDSLIGRGGMSAVYKALRSDGAFDEPVALKLLNAGLLATDWQTRFQSEVRFLASLRHPHIASLFDAGVAEDGTPWLVTELVDGVPIDEYCCRHKLAVRERVVLVRDLCAAVAFAQKNLIVHRDIKPDNVLVTDDGRVVLLDFGIARALDADPAGSVSRTMTRAFTPQFAAPEQLTGKPVTTATDVFGLGMLLYKVLTGEMPFSTSETHRGTRSTLRPSKCVLRATDQSTAERRRRGRVLSGDLDNIVLKALEERPERRYANAESMQSDLGAWLEYKPVMARAPSIGVRLLLFVRRRTALASALVGLVLVGAIGVGTTLWQAQEARNKAELANSVSDYLVTVFTVSDPTSGDAEDPHASDLLRRGSRQALQGEIADPAVAAELLRIIGSIQRKLGFFDDARLSLEAAENRLPRRRSTGRIRAEILMEAGMLDHDTGQFDQAVDRFATGLELLADHIGPQHPRLQDARADLAQLQVWSDPSQAVETLPLLRRMANDDGLETALRIKAARTLSMVLDSNGRDSPEAEQALLQALRLASDHSAIEPLRLSEIQGELGLLHLGRGNYAQASEWIERVLEIEREVFGPEHPRLAQIYGNLGFAYYYDDRSEAALSAFERAVFIGSSAWDPDHPNLALYRASMAGPMWAQGRGEQLDALAAELAGSQVENGYFAFLHTHRLLSLFDRGEWGQVVNAGQALHSDLVFQSLTVRQQTMINAIVARAALAQGQPGLASELVRDTVLPDHPPERWAAQFLSVLMAELAHDLGHAEAQAHWLGYLDSARSRTPVLNRLSQQE